MNVVRGTTVDGPGLRTSIYFSGCRHACPGCHNPQSWDFNSGREISIEEIKDIILEEDFDVTFSGGDPLYQPEILSELVTYAKSIGHTVWAYTGFTWEEIVINDILLNAIKDVDVIVDGRFMESMKDKDLLFRGSSNQRLIDVGKSIKEGMPVEYQKRIH